MNLFPTRTVTAKKQFIDSLTLKLRMQRTNSKKSLDEENLRSSMLEKKRQSFGLKSSFTDASKSASKKKLVLKETERKSGSDQQRKSIFASSGELEKENRCKVYLDGYDVTPRPFFSLIPQSTEVIDLKELGRLDTAMSMMNLRSASKSFSRIQSTTEPGEFTYQSIYREEGGLDDIIIYQSAGNVSIGAMSAQEDYTSKDESDVQLLSKAPENVGLILNETETFFTLSIASSVVLKDSREGDLAEEDNKKYEYLTTGKGRNRRVFECQSQTIPILQKTRETLAPRKHYKNASTSASNWEMYDTYKEQVSDDEEVDEEAAFLDDSDILTNNANKLHQYNMTKTMSVDKTKTVQNASKLFTSPKFLDAVCIIERLLANNNYNQQQKRFRGLFRPDDHREKIEYKYRLELLWTFHNHKSEGRCVTAIEPNGANTDIIAVGYGKFYFNETTTGLILIWNIKNPTQHEREYAFDEPVTTLSFSKVNPFQLAVGFYDGNVTVLDTRSRVKKIVLKSSKIDSLSFEPCWQVLHHHEEDKNEEYLIACFEDGRVLKYVKGKGADLKCAQIMRMARAEGKLKGISTVKACETDCIPISRYAADLFITEHPVDRSIYFTGTDEGVIHKCSINYYNQHLDLFKAHVGPVYTMRFSPFCNKVFLTCSDDWYVRLWVEGVTEPLLEMIKSKESVQGVDWNPVFSTIFVDICGKDINIWDIQRKVYAPQSSTPSPTNSRNTVCQFTDNGQCLLIGDIDGNVHVYSLEDMPFPAFFQEDLLVQALKRSLVAKPALLQKLIKIGRLHV